MQLIGYMDSPYVRRVAVTMQFLGIDFQHRELSIFRDWDEFRQINPLVKVPTLVLDDGRVLTDSTLIISFLESQISHRSLIPSDGQSQAASLELIGVALVAMEKTVQLVYETTQRPENLQHRPWVERLEKQLAGATMLMNSSVSTGVETGNNWLFGDHITQADITSAIAWRFMQHIDCVNLGPDDYPQLQAFSDRAEALPEFIACPISG